MSRLSQRPLYGSGSLTSIFLVCAMVISLYNKFSSRCSTWSSGLLTNQEDGEVAEEDH